MSLRARWILGLVAVLLLVAALALLFYALSPEPLSSLQATVDPALMVPPGGAP